MAHPQKKLEFSMRQAILGFRVGWMQIVRPPRASKARTGDLIWSFQYTIIRKNEKKKE